MRVLEQVLRAIHQYGVLLDERFLTLGSSQHSPSDVNSLSETARRLSPSVAPPSDRRIPVGTFPET